MRILVLMRHSQAQGFSAGGDLGRELTEPGRHLAADVGAWLLGGVRLDGIGGGRNSVAETGQPLAAG